MTSYQNSVEQKTEYIRRFDFDADAAAKRVPSTGKKQGAVTLGKNDRRKAIALLLVCGIIFICLIGVTAYMSKIQYDINSLNKQIQSTERSIQKLQVQIKTAANITNLESRAFALGMVYPTFNDIVYIESDQPPIEDFALALRETAYQ